MRLLQRWAQRFMPQRLGASAAERRSARPEPRKEPPADGTYHLIARTTIEDVEQQHTRRLEDLRPIDRDSPERAAMMLKPFDYSNGEWEALKAAMRPGDELWTFASSLQSWERLAGRAGIALVRQGEIVATMVTMRN